MDAPTPVPIPALALADRTRALWATLQPRVVRPAHWLLFGRAMWAERSWRLDDALGHWQALGRADPGLALAPRGAGRVLAALGHKAEAAALLAGARVRFPADVPLALEEARVLQASGRFDAARRAGEALLARAPSDPRTHEVMGRVLRGLGRFEEADGLLAAARARFPGHLGLAVAHAENAEARGAWAETLRRAEALAARFPRRAVALACHGAALKRMKRFDEADAVLAAAMIRFPGEGNLAVNHALVAAEKGDAAEALRRWSRAQARFGQHPRVRAGYLQSREVVALGRLDGDGRAPPALAAAEVDDVPLARFFTAFEALGSDCEFGFVQRHFGAEPLGLLRWAGIGFEQLVAGLEASFAGVGSTERTRLDLNPANDEYYTTDSLYGLSTHTFVLRNADEEEALRARMGRRLAYLSGKLLGDLAAADKIFVHRADGARSDDQFRLLHRVARGHGPVKLLCVRTAAAGERPGEVVLLAPGLARGLITRDGLVQGQQNIDFAGWLVLCRAAQAQLAQDAAPVSLGQGAASLKEG